MIYQSQYIRQHTLFFNISVSIYIYIYQSACIILQRNIHYSPAYIILQCSLQQAVATQARLISQYAGSSTGSVFNAATPMLQLIFFNARASAFNSNTQHMLNADNVNEIEHILQSDLAFSSMLHTATYIIYQYHTAQIQ